MMQQTIYITLLLLVGAINSAPADAADLKRNPFKPLFNADSGGSPASAQETGEEMKLRGILLAPEQPLVNLGGHIMGLGEEVNGYRLISVNQEHAVFRWGDDTVKMSLYEESDED